MKAKELKEKYIEFFKSKGHAFVKSAPLVPDNDPTVLFTTAGMHPLVPYLMGEKHPEGNRIVDFQKCIRTTDIEEIGDSTHHTFFEMLGNWSLGDYFKEGAIKMSFEFLTEVLKIPREKLAVSCFAGDSDAPKDTESERIWLSLGFSPKRIAFLGKKDNWWGPAGETGPCGPDSEMFYWVGKDTAPEEFDSEDDRWVEIWNDVFMEYNKKKDGSFEPLAQKNVDTGMGVERVTAILQGKDDDYLTELFVPIISKVEIISGKNYKGNEKSFRIIADHLKAAVFLLGEKIIPSKIDQGYVLRRLIRRAIRYGRELGIKDNFCSKIGEVLIERYGSNYDEQYSYLDENKEFILDELEKEETKFMQTLQDGLRIAERLFNKKTPLNENKFLELMQLDEKNNILKSIFRENSGILDISSEEIKNATITGKEAFYLYQSFGFPIEFIIELVREKFLLVDIEGFNKEYEEHQKLSRVGAEKKFKGGLADGSEKTARLHTAAHLLLAAMRKVLKKEIHQKGSNITSERMRFDFNFDRKLTDEEIKEIEDLVNKIISEDLPVEKEEMNKEDALKIAQGEFEDKYGNKVLVYRIGDFSVEICGGPHAKRTGELGKFKIKKQKSVGAGVRRLKAVLE